MTEKQGGSDVGMRKLAKNIVPCMIFQNFLADGTDTIAVGPPDSGDSSYRLHGYKWFTSATDAQMAFTLARLQDENGMVTKVSGIVFRAEQ